jgi:hypothetical protein
MLLAISAFSPRAARAVSTEERNVGEIEARVLPPLATDGTPPISGLTLKDDDSLPLKLVDPDGSSPKLRVTLEGVYPAFDWSLIVVSGGNVVHRTPGSGAFEINIPVLGPQTTVTLTAISPGGAVQSTRILLRCPSWNDAQARARDGRVYSRFHGTAGLDFTHLDYTQTGLPSLSPVFLSAKGSLEYWLKPEAWNLSISGNFTLLPVIASPSGYSIRFLGIDGRAGYVLPWISAPWRLTFMVGMDYMTTFTSSPSGDPFSYVNIGGPEFYSKLSRTFRSGASLDADFKLSSLSDQFTSLSLSSREIASGLTYNFPPDRGGRGFSLRFDWVGLSLQDVSGAQAAFTTLSLGGGYRW